MLQQNKVYSKTHHTYVHFHCTTGVIPQFVIQTFIEHLAIHHYSAKLAPSYLCAILSTLVVSLQTLCCTN